MAGKRYKPEEIVSLVNGVGLMHRRSGARMYHRHGGGLSP